MSSKVRGFLAFLAVLLMTGGGLSIQSASATGGGGNDKVTICHRTASETNPYVKITVDADSVDGDLGNDNGQGDHYLEHTGPVFPAVGADGKWGDIIPPIAGVHNGLNWTAEGQAIYYNADDNLSENIAGTPLSSSVYLAELVITRPAPASTPAANGSR